MGTIVFSEAAAQNIALEVGALRMSNIALEDDLRVSREVIETLSQQNADLAQTNSEFKKTIELLRAVPNDIGGRES